MRVVFLSLGGRGTAERVSLPTGRFLLLRVVVLFSAGKCVQGLGGGCGGGGSAGSRGTSRAEAVQGSTGLI